MTDGATYAVDCLNFPDMNGPFPSQIEWAYLSHFKSAAVILYNKLSSGRAVACKLTHLIGLDKTFSVSMAVAVELSKNGFQF